MSDNFLSGTCSGGPMDGQVVGRRCISFKVYGASMNPLDPKGEIEKRLLGEYQYTGDGWKWLPTK